MKLHINYYFIPVQRKESKMNSYHQRNLRYLQMIAMRKGHSCLQEKLQLVQSRVPERYLF